METVIGMTTTAIDTERRQQAGRQAETQTDRGPQAEKQRKRKEEQDQKQAETRVTAWLRLSVV